MTDTTTTLRGLSPQTPAHEPTHVPSGQELTNLTLRRTLQGLGPGARPAHPPCPVCRLLEDAPRPDLAACFGLAAALQQGAAELTALLCEMHRRLVHLILSEIANGPRRTGDDANW